MRMAIFKKSKTYKYLQICGEKETLMMGMSVGIVITENSMEFPQKLPLYQTSAFQNIEK